MIVALFPNEEIHSSFDIAKQIATYLAKHNIKVVSEDEKAKILNIPTISSINEKKIKFLISMGGDGTILRLAHKYSDLDAAILGINLGNLGFMADIPEKDIFPSIDDLISKKYTIENRIMIEGKTFKEETFFAANDVVFHRAECDEALEWEDLPILKGETAQMYGQRNKMMYFLSGRYVATWETWASVS